MSPTDSASARSVSHPARTEKRPPYVLVHGAWHGGWCWARVAERLRAAGHRVFTPTLTGLGDRAHLIAPNVGLTTHIEDVVSTLEMEDLSDVNSRRPFVWRRRHQRRRGRDGPTASAVSFSSIRSCSNPASRPSASSRPRWSRRARRRRSSRPALLAKPSRCRPRRQASSASMTRATPPGRRAGSSLIQSKLMKIRWS